MRWSSETRHVWSVGGGWLYGLPAGCRPAGTHPCSALPRLAIALTRLRTHLIAHRPCAAALPTSSQVLEAEYDAQKNVAPFLQNRVLRRIVQVGVGAGGPAGVRAPCPPDPLPAKPPRRRPACPATQTFTNDPSGDFSKWACNPHVVGMLREAQRLMDAG